MIEALGLDYPTIYLTLAKAAGVCCVVFYLWDQIDVGPRRRVSD
jgi:hypothetical protein